MTQQKRFAYLCEEVERAGAERDRLAEALREIRDHGTEHGHKCWALHQGDCADVFQEIARAALDEERAA